MVTPNSVFGFQNLLLTSVFFPHSYKPCKNTSALLGTVLKWITWKPNYNKRRNATPSQAISFPNSVLRMIEHLLITSLSTFLPRY